ncbi:hypothetical protein [Stutzerimonas stutzeri]|uniref:hypothetical protein n=1 Tax=Stutzerimonas stutzeri TaxID=316 RepID=UPI0015E2F047|nr:hypothetical protein [Stutzerimonas stutzeri]MBA1280308.1 hypothetical protein [Stutzerimonas stutzeri]
MKPITYLLASAALTLIAAQAAFAQSYAPAKAKHNLQYEMVLIRFENKVEALGDKTEAAEEASSLEDALASLSKDTYTLLNKPRSHLVDNGEPGVASMHETSFSSSLKQEVLEDGSVLTTTMLTPIKTGYSINIYATQPDRSEKKANPQVESTIELEYATKEGDAVATVNTKAQRLLERGQIQALSWETGMSQYLLLAQLTTLKPLAEGN